MNNSNNNKKEKKMPSKIPRTTKHKIDKSRGSLADKLPMMIERTMMKEESGAILSDQLAHSKQAPTILMELSKRQWQRMKKMLFIYQKHLSLSPMIKMYFTTKYIMTQLNMVATLSFKKIILKIGLSR